MSYSKTGNRPFEFASKTNHSHIIKDPHVQEFLKSHQLPTDGVNLGLMAKYLIDVDYGIPNSIEFIVAVDGGDTTVPIKSKFPSSTLTFFQFGANLLRIADLIALKELPFISPESISKLKELQRIKFTLPTKNIGLVFNGVRATLTYSVRKAVYDFFRQNDYLSTLRWFLFREYRKTPEEVYTLASHPENSGCKNIKIDRSSISPDYLIAHADGPLFLTDVFRLHEVVDEDLGAGGIIGYLRNLIEHFLLLDAIKGVYRRQKSALKNVLFIKDGPLGFFGQTANMYEPMRDLIMYLQLETNIYLVGIEKSGPFVEHAQEVKDLLQGGQAYFLSNQHIYTYIKPGNTSTSEPYGRTSYYGAKVLFKSRDERVYVVTIPTERADVVLDPKRSDFKNIDVILSLTERLRSDMYDNSLLPIALANKLVSLSNHPSSVLLEKFAKHSINGG